MLRSGVSSHHEASLSKRCAAGVAAMPVGYTKALDASSPFRDATRLRSRAMALVAVRCTPPLLDTESSARCGSPTRKLPGSRPSCRRARWPLLQQGRAVVAILVTRSLHYFHDLRG